MPRKLPWQQVNAIDRKSVASKSTVRREPAASAAAADGDDLDADITTFERPRKVRSIDREPSSSPPPIYSPPPAEEFMRDGYSADDAWIMVEDEFMATAKLFTRHLHQAEYDRLKRLAKSRNASTIKDISRPGLAGGPASVESKHRRRSEALDAKQRALLGPDLSDEDSGDDAWARNPHLAGLVSQQPATSSSLFKLAGVKSNTRAAAGFSKAPLDRRRLDAPNGGSGGRLDPQTRLSEDQNVDEDKSEDDLDILPRQNLNTKGSIVEEAPDQTSSTLVRSSQAALSPIGEPHRASRSSTLSLLSSPRRKGIETTSSTTSSFAERMAARKAAARKKERDEKLQVDSIDQVPTFLI